MIALLAFGLLGALVPALAFAAAHSTVAADCCTPPTVSCDGPAVACPVQQVCQQSSPLAGEDAQTPPFTPVIGEASWRERLLPPPESVAARPAALALGGPPAYLRFHRFLL